MKILYLILSTELPPFQQHMDSQKSTWATDLGENSVVWIFGSNGDETAYDPVAQSLTLPIPEIYSNILQKTLLGIEWALKNIEFDFLIRGNTSTYYENSRLTELLSKIDSNSLYLGGKLGRYRIPNGGSEDISFVSGACMMLSKASAIELSAMKTQEYANWEDDPAISDFLVSKKGAVLAGIPRNDLTDFEPFCPSTSHRVKSWKHADFPVHRFYELFAIYHSSGISRLAKIASHSLQETKRYRKEMPLLQGLNLFRYFRYLIRVFFSFSKSFRNDCRK